MDKVEKESLLSETHRAAEGDLDLYTRIRKRSIRESAWFITYLFVLHVTLLLVGLALWQSRLALTSETIPTQHWKPLSVGRVTSEEHSVDHSRHSKYSGPPNDENNKAWEDLIQPTFFGATEKELVAGNETVDDAVRIAPADKPSESNEYLAALGVYHELHCLRQLRMHLYRDVYYENLTEANERWFFDHLDHCIETIRLSIMCQADLSLYTFTWKTSTDTRPKAKSASKRQCVNWDEVQGWSMNRKISLWPRLLRLNGKEDDIRL
ncbi:hypothetical protein BU24DRAFT_417143 [Aaosphaeria arxii CBS 175.79]|uniref:Uncharacterized protein n=1 Tax=Aaosphaeria arxii CBS 175.79 TaxID=1450172 RepID=A0A6A5YA96_9PLEO|nr:uncharacterized protein BU24DRAFT_417143 [Aaosphaeria arxii CBS 175.79]KAF2021504.1 hypothetical protein BU24DRAFT_417143 [Aaosphaeria arxii CBS 175.79]